MTNTKGYRRGTRYMFARKFKQNGPIPLSTYMKIYKRGDIVDIKVRITVNSVQGLLLLIGNSTYPRCRAELVTFSIG